ncbi:hypothetical protein [Sorangium atrum]|uniref:MalT-like TPR region domain-containing protein n=1 Tax=Sorangium atrum TaxID=2995308 RepID=A0ABT5C4L5_9BACT|nr:hypothetical protein [Sorangium aterium]MDC0681312.1 hypothetical protein [Sorangium aterium]
MTGAAGGERSRLIRALALSRRFHLYLARCASPRAADQLVAEIAAELPRLGRADVRLVRLEPYSGRPSDAPLADGELADRVLVPLLDAPEELRSAIHLVDASRAAYADTEAWARFLSLWNEKRNVLGPSHGEVVVMLPAALAPVFAAVAPDVWSIRSGEYVIDEDASEREAGLDVRESGPMPMAAKRRSDDGLFVLPERLLEAHVAAPTALASASGRTDDALLLVRAVSPLALFGGDLVVGPWVGDFLFQSGAGALLSELHALEQRGLAEVAPPLRARRMLRVANALLAERRFGEAEALYSDLLALIEADDAELTAVALSHLAIAVAAQDRADAAAVHANRAYWLVGAESGRRGVGALKLPDVRQASALVQWCLGHLEHADLLDQMLVIAPKGGIYRWRPYVPFGNVLSRVLRLVERGRVARALAQSRALASLDLHEEQIEGVHEVWRIARADIEFLSGNIDSSLRELEQAAVEDAAWPAEHASLAGRREIAVALIEIVRGNEDRASKILRRARHAAVQSRSELDLEGGCRAAAFHAVTSGLLAMVTGDPGGAATWFDNARARIADWGRLGLDRRSRLRAQLFVELLRAALQPEDDGAVAAARDLTRQAEALLGDTAEDHMSRALAVAAHRELARRLAGAGGGDARAAAQRAAALAQPLGNLGVPAWDELLRAAERAR